MQLRLEWVVDMNIYIEVGKFNKKLEKTTLVNFVIGGVSVFDAISTDIKSNLEKRSVVEALRDLAEIIESDQI